MGAMVVLELEFDEDVAAALDREADKYEFESTTAYLHWIVRNRSVVFAESDEELQERLASIEERLAALENDEDEPDPADVDEPAEQGPVMEAVDELFEETTGADDEEISEAIASIEIEDGED